ncbi:hypothetical protein F5Y03DRAFT_358633 [Xylaria venustula]|nr:hypothetical protein F5Y03DRAFT_358633 [Xylaria venustula]
MQISRCHLQLLLCFLLLTNPPDMAMACAITDAPNDRYIADIAGALHGAAPENLFQCWDEARWLVPVSMNYSPQT